MQKGNPLRKKENTIGKMKIPLRGKGISLRENENSLRKSAKVEGKSINPSIWDSWPGRAVD